MNQASAIDDLLAQPKHAVLAVNRQGRAPQLTVVWFHWDGEAFLISTTRDRAKTRHIRRDPSVALLIDDPESGSHVAAYGRAELLEVGHAELTHILFAKYVPGTDPTAAAQDPSRIVIRIRPERMITAP